MYPIKLVFVTLPFVLREIFERRVMEKLSLLVFLTCGFTEVALFHLGFIQESSFVGSMTHLMGVQGLHPLIRENLTTFSESTSWLRCNTHALFFSPQLMVGIVPPTQPWDSS